jgi:hypothetical protein
VAPLDPGRDWLAAGITGLARQREWDAVAMIEGPGDPGDEVQFVALPDGRTRVESAPPGLDAAFLAGALAGSVDPPYRAVAVRRADRWAVGAVGIETAELDPDPGGEELALTWDGETLSLARDTLPTDPGVASALEEIAASRLDGPYAAHASRLEGALWEISILSL